MKQIHFFYQTPLPQLKNRNKLRDFIPTVCSKEKKRLDSINYIFCTDSYLWGINKQFLGHDTYTDIISFNYSAHKDVIEGEIYISVDRVKENASLMGVSILEELHRVIFHGVLHFCGYKDKLKADKLEMRAKEDFYLHRYFAK